VKNSSGLLFSLVGGNLQSVLGLPVVDGGLDRILREHGAVELDGGEVEVLGNVGVLDAHNLVHGLPLDPLGGHGGGRNRTAATERLELGVDDLAVLVHFNLELHHVAFSAEFSREIQELVL